MESPHQPRFPFIWPPYLHGWGNEGVSTNLSNVSCIAIMFLPNERRDSTKQSWQRPSKTQRRELCSQTAEWASTTANKPVPGPTPDSGPTQVACHFLLILAIWKSEDPLVFLHKFMGTKHLSGAHGKCQRNTDSAVMGWKPNKHPYPREFVGWLKHSDKVRNSKVRIPSVPSWNPATQNSQIARTLGIYFHMW